MRPLSLNAGFEKSLVRPKGGSLRHLVVEVKAPPGEKRRRQRPDLTLALVIDRSGSMSGARLEAAKTAAAGIVEGLRDGDRLSLVAFDHESDVLLQGCPMDADGRRQALAVIRTLGPGGMTNLGQGWFDGARCVAAEQSKRLGAMHRIVVLSDGKANQGVVHPTELGQHARKLADEGVLTSCVGIGDDYSPQQLQALADHGGGQLHDAGTTDEMIEIVLMELGEVLGTVAERVVLTLEHPGCVRPRALTSYPTEASDTSITCDIGSLVGGARRRVVFQIDVPPGYIDDELVFTARVDWHEPGKAAKQHGASVTATLVYARGPDRANQSVDRHRAQVAADNWNAVLAQEAVDRNMLGDVAGAAGIYDGARARYEALCLDTLDNDRTRGKFAEVRSATAEPLSLRFGKDLRDVAMAEERQRSSSRRTFQRRRQNASLRRLMEDAEPEAEPDAKDAKDA